jgi:endonuclease III
MEPHKELGSGTEEFRPRVEDGPKAYFEQSLKFALRFYGDEVRRISSVRLKDVDADFFFREYVWVVHATGFSAKAVGNFMPRLMEAYGPWAKLAGEDFDSAMVRVKDVCNNPQKAKAIHKTAGAMLKAVGESSWEEFRDSSLSGTDLLAELPYVGKITCFHLGRNIGLLECVKPDLHLVRMAEHWKYASCEEMCRDMRKGGHEDVPLGIVDLALWYAASTFGTLDIRKDGQR